jgi:hypothetical protein
VTWPEQPPGQEREEQDGDDGPDRLPPPVAVAEGFVAAEGPFIGIAGAGVIVAGHGSFSGPGDTPL